MAWYKRLSKFLLENNFFRGNVNIYNSIFEEKKGNDLLVVQIYVDDIIFRATNKDLC